MAVFHFTLHAYRSWNTDNPRGYVKRTRPGVQLLDERLARARDRLARFPMVRFDEGDKRLLVDESSAVAKRRGLILYGVTAIESHMHVVVGWEGKRDAGDVEARLKRGYGFLLALQHGTKGRPYFSRGGAPERVKNRKHLRFLLDEYLPRHHGPIWRAKLV